MFVFPIQADNYSLGGWVYVVAIAYVMHKATHVFPIIGGRKVEQLEQNIEGLTISLTPEQIKFLEDEAPAFDVGFPTSLIVCFYSFRNNIMSVLKAEPLGRRNQHLSGYGDGRNLPEDPLGTAFGSSDSVKVSAFVSYCAQAIMYTIQKFSVIVLPPQAHCKSDIVPCNEEPI